MNQEEIVRSNYRVRPDFRPRDHHLLVRWLCRTETKGGILMPENRVRAGIMKGVILGMGHGCDPRLEVGQTIHFGSYTEKEFVGPECPGDRDPVFFMRDEWANNGGVIGIREEGGRLQIVNGLVLIRPDKNEDVTAGGIARPTTEVTPWDAQLPGGVVANMDVDLAGTADFGIGDRVFYRRNTADELKLGDFEGELHHVVSDRAIEAVSEREAAHV